MTAFDYRALTAGGREKQGVVDAENARLARQQLRNQGLVPLAVMPLSGREKSAGKSAGKLLLTSVSALDLAVLYRMLAVMLEAGLSLGKVLNTVNQQMENRRLRRIVAAVHARVNEGHSLATGMGEFPGVFSELDRATVEAGEQSGHLGVVLERLADFAEARQQHRQKLQMAMLYPLILTLVSLAIVVGLLTYVIPEVVVVFEHTGQQLPALTRALIGSSGFLRSQGHWLLLGLVLLFVLFSFARRLPPVRYRLHRLALRLPLVGRLQRRIDGGRFTRTFGILNASGVPVLESMRIAANVITSLPMRRAIERAAGEVREGASIEQAMGRSGHFSPVIVQLIGAGEAGGRLDEMLSRSADTQESEANNLIAALMGLLEPLMILVMGGVVLTIVLAVLLPIFDLNQLAG